MNLSKLFRRAVGSIIQSSILREPNKERYQKNSQIFGESSEFSVDIQQTVSDSYLNKYPTIFVPHFSQVCFHNKDLMVLEFEVHYPFSRSNRALDEPRINQSNCKFVAGYTMVRRMEPRKDVL